MKKLLDEAQLAEVAGPAMLQRGRAYYRAGSVDLKSLRWEEPTLEAVVQGGRPEPYRVRITLAQSPDGLKPLDVSCTCPYDGRWCKHGVAALLAACDVREIFEELPLAQRLNQLSGDQAKALLRKLAAVPGVRSEIRSAITLISQGPSETWRKLEADARHRISQALSGVAYGWESNPYARVAQLMYEVREMLDYATALVRDHEYQQAIGYLTGMTDEYLKGWEEVDDESGDSITVVDQMVDIWLEAILNADLTAEQKGGLATYSAEWDALAAQYDVHTMAAWEVALKHGVDPERLRLAGEDMDPAIGTLVSDAWLRCLKRRGDVDAYFAYADATEHYCEGARSLVQLGQVAEGVEYLPCAP